MILQFGFITVHITPWGSDVVIRVNCRVVNLLSMVIFGGMRCWVFDWRICTMMLDISQSSFVSLIWFGIANVGTTVAMQARALEAAMDVGMTLASRVAERIAIKVVIIDICIVWLLGWGTKIVTWDTMLQPSFLLDECWWLPIYNLHRISRLAAICKPVVWLWCSQVSHNGWQVGLPKSHGMWTKALDQFFQDVRFLKSNRF